jgi:nucleotide-binding universal stress UspA family protein
MPQLQNVKNILIALHESGQDELSSALAYGMSLGRAAGAHVNVQAASVKIVLRGAYETALTSSLVAEENERVHRLTERIAADSRGEAAMGGFVSETSTPQLTYADLRDRLVAVARVNDYIIAQSDPSVMTIRGGLLRSLIFQSGRPVIVTPAGCETIACERVLVAWDGSAAAAAAVAAAMPFLRAASEVEIVCYVGEKDLSKSAAGADLAVALVRHGVNATAKELAASRDVAHLLREQAGLFRADMLVMGAFVHSPVREWLFGGVTQSLLDDAPVPLLLARGG